MYLTDVNTFARHTCETNDLIFMYSHKHENTAQTTENDSTLTPNNLANTLFKEQFGTRRLKRLYPADIVTNV